MAKAKWILTLIVSLTLVFVLSVGCDQDPISPKNEVKESFIETSQDLKVLSYKNESNSLKKLVNRTQMVTVQGGGSFSLNHGSPDGVAANLMYGNNLNAPYNVYKIDPENPSNSTVIGQLAFSSSAIAMNPMDGLIYYAGNTAVNGVYPVGVWDPATNSNVILPNGSEFKPASKLACGPDGTLYGISDVNSSDIFEINTTTGVWSLVSSIVVGVTGAGGDIAVDASGTMYSLRISGIGLQTIDLSTGILTTVGDPIDFKKRSGLCFVNNGQLYLSRKNGDIYALDKTTGVPTFKGNIGLGALNDLAPVIAENELSYASISLKILPGTISEDVEVSLELETTELQGGVAVTFEPHGTSFTQPAILNIEAYGIDFTGIDPNSVDIYYDNPETGLWELMPRASIIVDADAGYVKVEDAELPHFSRYAIGME